MEKASQDAEEVVCVVVGRELAEVKATLLCALQNCSPENEIVVVLFHQTLQLITSMGIVVTARQLNDTWVGEYRRLEREKINKILDEYLTLCSKAKRQAVKLIVEMDDVGEGLLEMIEKHGVNCVTGAAADKHYLSNKNARISKTAIKVQQHAVPACNIWFFSEGILFYTRDEGIDGYQSEQLTARRLSTIFRKFMLSRSTYSPKKQVGQEILTPRSKSILSSREGHVAALPVVRHIKLSPSSMENSKAVYTWEVPPASTRTSVPWNYFFPPPSRSGSEEALSSISLSMMLKDEDQQFSLNEDAGVNDDVFENFHHALKEVEDLRSKLNEESCMRHKAEGDAAKAVQKAKASENLYIKESQQRKEAEEMLARENMELEELKVQQKKMFEELEMARAELKLQNSVFDSAINASEAELSAAHLLLSSLQSDYDKLQLDRDIIVKQYEELFRTKEEATTGTARNMSFSEFSYLDIEKATNNFNESMKIGEGGYGIVYKGSLRHTTVAIKMMKPENMHGLSEFHQEVNVLSELRHPHLVTLIGTCPEACALIYEYCTNGSLEDRLDCKNNTAPLKWQVRMRIAAEICSSLIFLHSSKPLSVVHADLKPANILINENFVSKLGDFGICRHLVQSDATTPYLQTNPKGTFGYLDPEFLVTGELTPYCDIYAFGIVLLRLLTGRNPPLAKEVQEALRRNCLHQIIDPTAGKWPFVQAEKLAQLALKCCGPTRKGRPNLEVEVWKTFEPIMKAALSGRSSYLTSGSIEDNTCLVSCFLCPISQEIMKDPRVAADGHTYEAGNIKEWFRRGHDTSPMTNDKLRHTQLIPNLTLSSAIREWQQLHT